MDENGPVRFGDRSLRIDFDLRNISGTEAASIGFDRDITLDGDPSGIGLWVYAPEGTPNLRLRIRVTDATGLNHTLDLTQGGINWAGWRYLEADLSSVLGPVTLKRGETMTIPLGCEKVDIKRIVEWADSGVCWDAVKFKNPFKFPMTFAKMEVTEAGRILGMPKVEWTNPGAETFVKIAEASSIKSSYEEVRESKSSFSSKVGSFGGETTKINGRLYGKAKISGVFKLTNFRSEKALLNVKRIFRGEIIESSFEPTKTKDLPSQDFGINPEHELTWEFELSPNETREFTVTYAHWVSL